MAKSGDSFGKKEKEKQRAKHKQDKAEKMQERKSNAKKKSLDDMMAYIDENGNIVDTPPDPSRRRTVNAEDIEINVAKQRPEEDEDPVRTGTVAFFNEDKGFGFINDSRTKERIFLHIRQLSAPVQEGDQVQFEIEQGPKGLAAVNVKPVR